MASNPSSVEISTALKIQSESDRIAALQWLEQQRRVVTTMVSAINDFVYLFDRQGRFRFVNQPLLDLWGLTLDEAVGKTFHQLPYEKELADRLHREIQEVIDKRHPVSGETSYINPEGHEGWYEYIFSPVFAADGHVEFVAGSTRNITEHKRLLRDRDRIQEELLRARDEAIAASRAKDDFLAILSHELRTPLNPILLVASDAAARKDFPEEVRNAFSIVQNNVELEARLIDDLLDLTSIARGKTQLRCTAVDVESTIEAAVIATAAEIAQKGISLQTDLNARGTVAHGDPARLQQIFLNLLRNACKFTPKGGVIRVQTRVGEEGRITIDVSDTGFGLTREEMNRVFEPFAQGDHAKSSGSPMFGGLGLGLAISRRLVEMHRGELLVRSEGRHKGAVFTVVLPLLKPSATDRDSRSPFDPAGQASNGSGKRILLVEDHTSTREAMTRLLTNRGYRVKSAGSLAQARELAGAHVFDILVSDIGLPDGTGYELMEDFRGREGLYGIALTGYGMEQDVARSRAAGFAVQLTKPVRIDALEVALAGAVRP